ncbi:MAG: hypothetical protein R3E79_09995 [Caldilineaceae bacterium]
MIEPSIEREITASEEQATTNPPSSQAMTTTEEADAARTAIDITATVADEGLDLNERDEMGGDEMGVMRWGVMRWG